MIDITKIYYFIFGLITLLGGVMGFVKAGSKASIISGSVAGGLLAAAGVLLITLRDKPHVGLGVGIVITLALLSRFLPQFLSTHKFMPAGMITVLGIISIILSVLAVVKR
ncbi:MAG TPA: TMEM14 family protein [Chthoniobacterales bacterium]